MKKNILVMLTALSFFATSFGAQQNRQHQEEDVDIVKVIVPPVICIAAGAIFNHFNFKPDTITGLAVTSLIIGYSFVTMRNLGIFIKKNYNVLEEAVKHLSFTDTRVPVIAGLAFGALTLRYSVKENKIFNPYGAFSYLLRSTGQSFLKGAEGLDKFAARVATWANFSK